jgi:hypothetical protein
MIRNLLFVFIAILFISCEGEKTSITDLNEKKPIAQKKFGKNKIQQQDTTKMKVDSVKVTTKVNNDETHRKKNNYECMYPELSKIILDKMMKRELDNARVAPSFLSQEFYDIYIIDYTDPRVLKFLDETITNFVDYTVKKNQIDLKKINSDSTANIIIKSKK